MKISQIPINLASLIIGCCIKDVIKQLQVQTGEESSVIGTLQVFYNFLSLNSSDLVGDSAEYPGGWPNYKAKCDSAFWLFVDQFSGYSHGPIVRLGRILWAFSQGTRYEAEKEILPHLKHVPEAKIVLSKLINKDGLTW